MKSTNQYTQLYKDGVNKLLSSKDSFLSFLTMASYQSKIPIHSTVQLFSLSNTFKEMGTFPKWQVYGRQVTGGQKATKVFIYDKPIALFNINQTIEIDNTLNTHLNVLTDERFKHYLHQQTSDKDLNELITAFVSEKIGSVWDKADTDRKDFTENVATYFFQTQLGINADVDKLTTSFAVLNDKAVSISDILKDVQLASFLLKNTLNEMVLIDYSVLQSDQSIEAIEVESEIPGLSSSPEEVKTEVNEPANSLDKEVTPTTSVQQEVDINNSSDASESDTQYYLDNGIYFLDRFFVDVALDMDRVRVVVHQADFHPLDASTSSKEVYTKLIQDNSLSDDELVFDTTSGPTIRVKDDDSLLKIINETKDIKITDTNYPLVYKEMEQYVLDSGEKIYSQGTTLRDYKNYYSKTTRSVYDLQEFKPVDVYEPFKFYYYAKPTYQLSTDHSVLTATLDNEETIELTIAVSDFQKKYKINYQENIFYIDNEQEFLDDLQIAIVGRNYLNTQLGVAMEHHHNFVKSIEIKKDIPIVEITNDHLSEVLKKTGTLVVDGKLRVQQIIQSDLKTSDKTKAIKNEFGTGGGSAIDISDEFSLSYSFNSVSYSLSQFGVLDNSKKYNWGEIVQQLKILVETDNYLSDEDKIRYLEMYPDNDNREISLFDLNENDETSIQTSDSTQPVVVERNDFSLIESDNFQYSTNKRDKIQDNLTALKLLKELDTDNSLAMPEEQEVLAKYVGWGGLSEIFDDRDSTYLSEREELKSLVSDSEYRSMRESVLTAYYTSPMIIKEMYTQLERMGFTGGRILDPAMGTGNFFTAMPAHLKEQSELVGVELESITGNIAKHLTQKADIQIKGFEKTNFTVNEFDVVVGNVPFNNLTIQDSRYQESYLIHDYFFKRSLDLVKEGGIVAFITSTGTLDKKSKSFREEISQNTDFLGSVRLPNTAFKDIAGTSVTTDIIFLQKNTSNALSSSEWLSSSEDIAHEKVRYNNYYQHNPEKLLGSIEVKHFNGLTFSLRPFDSDLNQLLSEQLQTISGQISPRLEKNRKTVTEVTEMTDKSNLDAEHIPLFTYFIDDKQQLVYRDTEKVEIINPKTNNEKKLRSAIEIRVEIQKIIELQQRDYTKDEFETQLAILNQKYDTFVSKNGYLNDFRRNLTKDMYYPIMMSLEEKNEDGTYSKSQIMYEPTVKPYKKIEAVSSAIEALHVSLAYKNKVDLDYMSRLSSLSSDQLLEDLDGHVYFCPIDHIWLTREEYLSGDVKTKLMIAESHAAHEPDTYNRNAEALKSVIPKPIEVKDIEVSIGSTWLPQDIYYEFVQDVLDITSYDIRHERIVIEYESFKGTWFIKGRNGFSGKHEVTTEYGTKRANALYLLNDALNLKKTTIYDTEKYYEDGKEKTKRILNPEETVLARAKQNDLHVAFNNWIFNDYERAERLAGIYNEKFNRYVTREYDGSHLQFDSLNKNYELRSHQRNVVSRISQEGRALMAHVVGAGKTLSMIASGMTMKEQGTIHKPMYVVPNHLVNEFAIDIVKFYPTKNVLITTKKDFQKENRKAFVAKMTSGNFDAVVIGHSQFEKIPLSHERRELMIRKEIDTLQEAISLEKEKNQDGWSIKQMIRFEKTLEKNLEKLLSEKDKDDHITFENTGVDFLFVDEAHIYKNLYTYTKLSNVAGVNSSHSQRASDMQMKITYLQETNSHGKGVVLATGTPISNSMSELYTMQRYLQPDMLKQLGCSNFDSWASTFGEITSSLEINPEGSGYQIKDRFAKFHNLPELMTSFSQVADIQTADMLNLPTPEIKTGKAQVIVTEPTEQQEILMDEFAERADLIRTGQVDPSDDNLLKLTHEAKLMAIDVRLLDDTYASDETSKLSVCCKKVFDIWESTKDKLSTQMIFSDSGTPKKDKFNVYDEVKTKLMAKGIPEKDIAFIHDYKTDLARKDLFSKIRTGQVRILLGSTSKVGTGTNIQDKLLAVHHIDCPWRPSDIEQRNGRIVRQGNENKEVEIYQYVTKGTFDSFLWQTQENKLIYINQVMNGSSLARSSADLSETVLSAAEIKALATSNPFIAEKMSIENELNQLRLQKNEHNNSKIQTTKKIVEIYPNRIKETSKRMDQMTSDIESMNQLDEKEFSMVINNLSFSDRIEAGKYLKNFLNGGLLLGTNTIEVGQYKGFELSVQQGSFDTHVMKIQKQGTYVIDINIDSGSGMLTRLDNLINNLPKLLEKNREENNDLSEELEKMKVLVDEPFKHEEKLTFLQKRLYELDSKIEKASLEKTANKDKQALSSDNKSHKEQRTVNESMSM